MVEQLLHPPSITLHTQDDANSQHFSITIADFFVDKIIKLKNLIGIRLAGLVANPLRFDRAHNGDRLCDLEPVTLGEVVKLLNSMPAKSSPLDIVPTVLLKKCSSAFAPVIVYLANLSFSEGKFPSIYKRAQVSPLLKKEGLDPDSPSSYRPISNLNTISKILERLFLERLKKHLFRSENFKIFQSAYRQFHSTETALLRILDGVYHSVDETNVTCLAALDLSAAFDTLEHSTLIDRLQLSFGLDGTTLAWIRSYLTGRSQTVKFDGVCSPSRECSLGVPQGSVLGPMLFTLFIAPVAHVIGLHGVSFHQFADDTQLFISLDPKSPDTSLDALDRCSEDVLEWFTHNGLSLNPTKTEILFMGTRQMINHVKSRTSVQVAGCSITPSDNLKSLGVTLDNNLTFDKHVGNICRSASYHIRALKHIRRSLTLDMAKSVATAIVGSRLDYCNSLLYGVSKKNINKLQSIQNSLARVVTQRRKYDRITPVLIDLHWLPVEQRIRYKISTLVFKIRQSKQPAYLASLINDYVPGRDLRSSEQSKYKLAEPRSKTVLASRRFSSAAPVIWNSIPLTIQSSQSLDSFKSKLKTHLFKLAYAL
jgi:hypothetical protein